MEWLQGKDKPKLTRLVTFSTGYIKTLWVLKCGSNTSPEYQQSQRKAKFSISVCDVIFLVRLQGGFDIEYSWE